MTKVPIAASFNVQKTLDLYLSKTSVLKMMVTVKQTA